jgi:Ca2+-transporting ATPase
VTPLDAYQWGIILAASLSMVIIVEIVKFFQRKVVK